MTEQQMILAIRAEGFTQAQIASELGCAQSSVNAWENGNRGQSRGISGKYLLKLIEMHRRVCGDKPKRQRKAA